MQPLIGKAEVSELTGIPERTLDQYAYLGKGPVFVKLHGHRRYRPEDIEAWITENLRGSTTQRQPYFASSSASPSSPPW